MPVEVPTFDLSLELSHFGVAAIVEVPTLTLELSLVAVAAVVVPPAAAPDPDRPWSVVSVDQYGTVLGPIPNANPGTITKTLDAEDEFTFTSPKYDPATSLLRPLSEVQILRGDRVKTWGPITGDSASSADGAAGFAGRGVWWYFRRLFFGTAERTNMIRNGTFELGPADGTLSTPIPGWSKVGGLTARHYTSATKPGGHGLPDPLRGTKAVALASDEENANTYLQARFPYRTDFPPGQRLTFAAWVYIGDGWIGPAAMALGLYAVRMVDGEVETQAFAAITDETERGDWVRLECSFIVRPHRDGYVEVRLYSPAGWVAWDEALSVLMESTGAGFAGADQVELAATIVRYGQTGVGKTSKNVGTYCLPTGVHRVRAWQHADHDWLADAVAELAAFTDGFDFDVELTRTSRTFRTYFPRKGTDRTEDVILRLGAPADGGNVASYSYSRDGGSVATSVVSRGRGDGPDREEGAAMDATALDGLILEDFVDAPANLPIGELDDYAEAQLESKRDVIEVLEVVTHEGAGELIDLLETGDVVGADMEDGFVVIGGTWRVVKMIITCRGDTLTLTLNRET